MERHTTDALSLVFGLLFTAVAVIGLTDVLALSRTDVRWVGPGLLVLIGVVLVVTAGLGRGRSDDARHGQRHDHDAVTAPAGVAEAHHSGDAEPADGGTDGSTPERHDRDERPGGAAR